MAKAQELIEVNKDLLILLENQAEVMRIYYQTWQLIGGDDKPSDNERLLVHKMGNLLSDWDNYAIEHKSAVELCEKIKEVEGV